VTQLKQQVGYGDYTRFRDLVLARSGLYFPERKRTDLEIGLLKALQNAPAGIGDLDGYYRYLSQPANAGQPAAQAEMERLLNLLTVGETHFFRDSAQFDALTTHILPSLIAKKRAASSNGFGLGFANRPQLRIWCAGCASGEEPYSLAILLYELIPDLRNWSILLLATDINQESLGKAKQALYSDWSFREQRALSARALYFNRVDGRYQLREEIRQMVTFARHNLIEDEFPAYYHNTVHMDLILCRNVTIYFSEMTTRQLVGQFYETLAKGGWLIVGHSEPSLLTYHAFRSHSFPGALLYQKGEDDMSQPEKEDSRPTEALLVKQEVPGEEDKPLAAQPGAANQRAVSDLSDFLGQPGTSETVASLLENSLHSLAPAVRTSAYCYLARFHADHSRWGEARRWVNKAIGEDSLAAEAYYLLALVSQHEGDVDAAIANLKKVVYLGEEGPVIHFNLALLYRQQGDLMLARRSLGNAIKLLEKWPPERPMPYSDGLEAQRLLVTVRRLLLEFEAE
jgi:chemotaxis protein methyltransferase CheR